VGTEEGAGDEATSAPVVPVTSAPIKPGEPPPSRPTTTAGYHRRALDGRPWVIVLERDRSPVIMAGGMSLTSVYSGDARMCCASRGVRTGRYGAR
jgi:hypothetical protein